MTNQFAVYSKYDGVVRVHYSHLSEDQAEAEVNRMNNHLLDRGIPAVYWAEEHHPDHIFVIG